MSKRITKAAATTLSSMLLAGGLVVAGPSTATADEFQRSFSTWGANAFHCDVRTKDAVKKLKSRYLQVRVLQNCKYQGASAPKDAKYKTRITYSVRGSSA